MVAPGWRALSVVLNDRAAIYAEDFSGVLGRAAAEVVEGFTHDKAQDLLYTFAGAWPSLGRDAGDSTMRFVYLAIGNVVCRFRGVELAVGAIVIDDVVVL